MKMNWGEVSGQLHAPAALPLGYEPAISTGQEVGWASELVWTRWNVPSLPLVGIDPRSSSPQPGFCTELPQFKVHFNNIISMARSPKWSLTSGFSNQYFVRISHIPMPCPCHPPSFGHLIEEAPRYAIVSVLLILPHDNSANGRHVFR
jgi:hypothetical protein